MAIHRSIFDTAQYTELNMSQVNIFIPELKCDAITNKISLVTWHELPWKMVENI